MNKETILKISSLALLLVAVAGMMYLVYNSYLLATNAAGIVVQVAAVGLFVWGRVTFGVRSFHAAANTTAGKLVTNGPYRWFRHPLYAALIYFAWAGVACHFYTDAIAAAVIITLGLTARMLLEEKFLLAAYDDYAAYMKHTFRLLPFVW